MTVAFAAASIAAAPLLAQARPYGGAQVPAEYAKLLRLINAIPIYDMHAHPGYASDADVDAMASPPNLTEVYRFRAENPEVVAAAKSLFGYPYADLSPEHARWLVAKKAAMQKQLGDRYFSVILDKLGIETSAANRPWMPDYLDPKRFAWVSFADSYMWPFDNSAMLARNSDQAVFIPMQAAKLRKEMGNASQASMPGDLAGYLAFITKSLEQNKEHGSIAIKFEAAYFRSLRFDDPPFAVVAPIYAKYRSGGVPTFDEYTAFQDFIMRHLIREAGRLHEAVQFHTAVGIGDYFSLSGGNIMNLENILRDPRYDGVTFVMIHGGYPHEHEAILLGAKKNVHLETSYTGMALVPSQFKEVLKQWLMTFPEHVSFGSDAFPYSEAVGVEESYWMAVQAARQSLAAALAELVEEHAVTEAEAIKLAHGYLHDNGAALYPAIAH